MKYLLLLIAISVTLFSCSDVKPDDSTTVYGTSKLNKQHYEPTTDGAGNITGQKAVDDSVAFIKPTWGQAFHYANESGYTGQKVAAIGCLAALALVLFLLIVGKIQMNKGSGAAMFVCVCGFLGFMFGKPAAVKWSNYKEVDVSVYRATTASGSSQVIWDNYYNDNKLVGAASK